MSLTTAKKVPQNTAMLGSELAYVRAQLAPLDATERKEISARIGVHEKTLKRIASRETKYGRTDTVGKIALYFRTREKRKR
jgi:hypothetical protein